MIQAAKDWMALTPADKKDLAGIVKRINEAIAADCGQDAAHLLQEAEDRLRNISRRQFWSTR